MVLNWVCFEEVATFSGHKQDQKPGYIGGVGLKGTYLGGTGVLCWALDGCAVSKFGPCCVSPTLSMC